GHPLQKLAEISAAVWRDLNRRYKNQNVRQRHSKCHILHCTPEGHSEFLLLIRGSEFFADRGRQFIADELETRRKRVSRANRASQEIHRFGKLFFEFVKSPLANCGSNHGGDCTSAKGRR